MAKSKGHYYDGNGARKIKNYISKHEEILAPACEILNSMWNNGAITEVDLLGKLQKKFDVSGTRLPDDCHLVEVLEDHGIISKQYTLKLEEGYKLTPQGHTAHILYQNR